MRTRAYNLFLDKYHFTVYTFTVYRGFILAQIATSSSRIKSELTASILTSPCPDSSSHVVDTSIDVVSFPNESEVFWTFCCVNRSQSKTLWIFECIACIRPRELVIVCFRCCCSLSLRRSSRTIKNRTFGRYICTAALQVCTSSSSLSLSSDRCRWITAQATHRAPSSSFNFLSTLLGSTKKNKSASLSELESEKKAKKMCKQTQKMWNKKLATACHETLTWTNLKKAHISELRNIIYESQLRRVWTWNRTYDECNRNVMKWRSKQSNFQLFGVVSFFCCLWNIGIFEALKFSVQSCWLRKRNRLKLISSLDFIVHMSALFFFAMPAELLSNADLRCRVTQPVRFDRGPDNTQRRSESWRRYLYWWKNK